MFKTLLFAVLAISIQNVNSARILAVVPTASYSHQMFFQQLWRELAIRGHDIVVITTDPTGESLTNFTEISIRESYPLTKEAINLFMKEPMMKLFLRNKLNEMFTEILDFQLSLPQLKEIINNRTEHFDLLMVEHMMPIMLAFKHRFQCPMIGVTSMDAFTMSHAAVGNPVHSILYPMSLFPFQENLTFIQRLTAGCMSNIFEYLRLQSAGMANQVIRKHFGEHYPHVEELVQDTDMLFVNANPLFSPVRPHTPATISIAGGMHMKPAQPLPKDLKDFLDNADKGVIYFSLGSNVKSKELSLDMRQIIMEALAQVPYKVLWKFEDDSLPGKPDNVKITKWAPQQDVLRHPNVKLFVTQGGIQSLEEALYSHVPLVAIPFFGDQESNAEKVKTKGLGVVLDRHNLKVEDLKAAILEVMDNQSYRNNIKLLAERIQDEPMKPLEKAIWWTEYVLRHKGAKHLRGPKIPFYQYYYFDLLAFLSAALFVSIAIVYGIAKLIIRTVKCMFKCQTKTIKVKKS